MFDLGASFLASVARDGRAEALVDGDLHLTYEAWYRRISAAVAELAGLGIRKGDRVLTSLQNTADAATLHWACQFAGVIITPVNWRASADEIRFFIENAEAKAIFHDASSAEACGARDIPVIDVAGNWRAALSATAPDAAPMAGPEDWSLMLYTSGTTGRPKGVPRRHRAERAAALAHIAQNMMPFGDRTLGVMPLYHTMGVRSLLAMSALNGSFVCLPRFDAAAAINLIETERIGSLYLVPTLYHDLLADPAFASADLSAARRLGYAGAPMTDGLLSKVVEAFRPDSFVNHYGSSEVYTYTIDQSAATKPGSAGKAGLNQIIRVIRLGAEDPDDRAAIDEEGQIIAHLSGDEAFEGYWRRPEADEKSLKHNWFFTGDTGRFDQDGDIFVTGRVDDMIITGGENVSPVDVESCLSLHASVDEVGVVGLPDERWGQVVSAFIKRKDDISEDALTAHCSAAGLPSHKLPRRYVFVADVPKSPVGKLLRRCLVSGDYKPE